jgi:alkylation response protein AidB-like acyl-CoA dehydrogenase
MLVDHEPTATVAATLVAPLQASVQSAVTARVSPGPRFTATESSEPRVLPDRWVTKCTTTDAAPWNIARFLSLATGIAARSKVPMPIPSTPTAIVSGGSGVADGVGVADGDGEGLGVGVAAPEHADSSTTATAASQEGGRLDIVTHPRESFSCNRRVTELTFRSIARPRRLRSVHFSAEHDALRETVRDFVARELRPHADAWEAAEGFPDSVFTRMGELGLLGLRYPERYGGQGGDYFSAIVLAEEMARCGSGGVGMAISVHTEMATPPILKWGTEEQKQRYLVPAIRGEKIAALGITEPDAGSDVASIRTRADRVDGHWRINGSKLYITNGVRCDFILLVARTGSQEDGAHGITLFLVDKNLPGFTVSRKLKKLGMHSSDTAELSFNDVEVGDEAVLGEVGQGFYNLMWELQGERLIGSAGSIAGAEVAFEETLKWCKEREAFGRPIAKFQVNRHKLVDLYTEITVAKNFVYSVAERWDRDEYPVTEISMAKLLVGRVTTQVADTCLQLHGGMGYMADTGISRYFRDSRLIRIGGGTDEVMKEIIARTALGL